MVSHVQRAGGALTIEFVSAGLADGKVQVAGVDRPAANHALHAFVFNRAQGFNVRQITQAARAITGIVRAWASLTVASILMPLSIPSRPISV